MKTIWEKLFFIFAVTALFLTDAALADCPQLEGAYLCPKTDFQDELPFTLERTVDVEGRHHYTFRYEGYPDSTSIASPTGVLNEEGNRKTWVYCLNDQLVYFNADSTTGWIQQSYRASNGDYVVVVRGREFLRCPSQVPTKK